jgi:hypothetical protein
VSEGPKEADISLFSLEDGKRSSFRNVAFPNFLEALRVNKAKKASNSSLENVLYNLEFANVSKEPHW